VQASVKLFRESLESLDRVRATAIFQDTLTTLTPIQAVEQLLVPALTQVGDAWHDGQVALSQISSCQCSERAAFKQTGPWVFEGTTKIHHR